MLQSRLDRCAVSLHLDAACALVSAFPRPSLRLVLIAPPPRQLWMMCGVIRHVCDDHEFKDEKLFYR